MVSDVNFKEPLIKGLSSHTGVSVELTCNRLIAEDKAFALVWTHTTPHADPVIRTNHNTPTLISLYFNATQLLPDVLFLWRLSFK